jgi:hypothetical protein
VSRILFRPLPVWTDPVSTPTGHQFKAGWSDTVEILKREVDTLNGARPGWTTDAEIVLQVDSDERNMRRDGGIRADARVNSRGVVVSFTSKHGPLRYACDTFEASWWGQMPSWQANVRAIALGLEALRKIDRYGIAGRGEQYTGWAQLGTGMPPIRTVTRMTADEAVDVIGRWRHHPTEFLNDAIRRNLNGVVDQLYKRAAKVLHPDAGGDADEFKRVVMARNLLVNL